MKKKQREPPPQRHSLQERLRQRLVAQIFRARFLLTVDRLAHFLLKRKGRGNTYDRQGGLGVREIPKLNGGQCDEEELELEWLGIEFTISAYCQSNGQGSKY